MPALPECTPFCHGRRPDAPADQLATPLCAAFFSTAAYFSFHLAGALLFRIFTLTSPHRRQVLASARRSSPGQTGAVSRSSQVLVSVVPFYLFLALSRF